MKKGIVTVLIAATLSAACVFGLSACGNEKGHKHSFTETLVAPTCIEQGYTLHKCKCGVNYKDNYTEAKEHAEVAEDAVEPTCTKSGRTEGKYCPDCGKIFAVQTILPANGHSPNEYNVCYVCGENLASKGIIYTPNEDGQSYSVTGTDAVVYSTDLYIASTYNGKPVTSIGESAFSGMYWITSVTIPHSVISIERYAFQRCSSLKSITIPHSVASIGLGAFGACDGLTKIEIPFSVTSIEAGAFRNCYNLTSITVESGNRKYFSVNDCVIETESNTLIIGCASSVIPSDRRVTRIGDNSFDGCKGLTSIAIPDNITAIGDYAFNGCNSLENITMSSSVTEIGHAVFAGCSSLKSITLSDKITEISGSAFSNCSSLTEITVPSLTKSIKSYAFYGCSGLTSITIPSLVGSIGVDAFAKCDNLAAITVDSANTTYHSAGNCIIKNEDGMLVIGCGNSVIPDDGSVTGIGYAAFDECNSLTEIVIPESVTYIGDHAFYGCGELTSIAIPAAVKRMGNRAFESCNKLKTITVDSGNAIYCSAGNCVIERASGTLIIGCNNSVIPYGENITKIGSYAFSNCKDLTEIVIPSSITSIGERAFYCCENLTSITIPSSVTSIEEGTFSTCIGLESVTIPSSVTSIGEKAFYCCFNLKSIVFEGTTDEWKTITKGNYWNNITGDYTVKCSNGEVKKGDSEE